MPFCSKCGTEVPIDVSFCSKCGNKLQGEQSPTPIAPKVEVSTQSDDTKPTLYNPIAIACWGLMSPLFSHIMLYLNYKTLAKALPMLPTSPTNNEPKSNNDLFGDIKPQEPQDLSKGISNLPIFFIIMGVLSIILLYILPFLSIKIPMFPTFLLGILILMFFIFPFLMVVELKKHIKFIYGSEEYNKKPLLIPVIIMIAVITFLIIALMLM